MAAIAQGTVPTFRYRMGVHSYTLVGQTPDRGATTTIPTLLVPIRLNFESRQTSSGEDVALDAAGEVSRIEQSPVFASYSFSHGGDTQYGDALLRASFPKAQRWHTLLGKPRVQPVSITVPAADGYVLTSKRSGGAAMGVVDLFFLQAALFRQIPREPGTLVIAVTRNTTFYGPRPTLCCSWGTHGVDTFTGDSFVLSTYLDDAPAIVTDRDVQPLTQQLAEFLLDPLHNPLEDGASGNVVPAWKRPGSNSDDLSHCVTSIATARYLLEPTSTNLINQFPASPPYTAAIAGVDYHLANVALLPWYTRHPNPTYSFPGAQILPTPAAACQRGFFGSGPGGPSPAPAAHPVAEIGGAHGHELIGYWAGYGSARNTFPLRDVSPQWDVVIVSFAAPNGKTNEGILRFEPPAGMSAAQLQEDIAYLQHRGKKVLLSLGGGGVIFDLNSATSLGAFVNSVSKIVSKYGFNGVDVDVEIPSMLLQPGDTDFRHPTTPAIVHMIEGLRALHDIFGPRFMISLVPEGPQVPAGYVAYGGGFGSYLPIIYGLRDILAFVDIQNYNTPPLEGLDGNIYQLGTVGYYASQNELLLHGFDVAHNPAMHFPGLPADKVAVGFITGSSASVIGQSLEYLITGRRPAGVHYHLQQSAGYPNLLGAMFWSINSDRRENYRYSNTIGPELHQRGGGPASTGATAGRTAQ